MGEIYYLIGIQSFPEIKESGYAYAGEAGYLKHMMSARVACVFLSRPRRFGKSLMLSAIKAFFDGRRDLAD